MGLCCHWHGHHHYSRAGTSDKGVVADAGRRPCLSGYLVYQVLLMGCIIERSINENICVQAAEIFGQYSFEAAGRVINTPRIIICCTNCV